MLKDIRKNPLMLTDTYNLGHEFLKSNTDWEVSHMYNRANSMILYGLAEIAINVLTQKITEKDMVEAKYYSEKVGVIFPETLISRVINDFNGYAPIKIESLPEGTYCPTGTPFAQIRNTVKGFGELVTWWEAMLTMSYFPCSCATEAFNIYNYLKDKREQYGFDKSFYSRVHNFGFRGSKSLEDAYWAGTAWNLFLSGTDDFHTAQHNIDAPIQTILALAHKVIQQFDDEYECFTHAVDTAYKYNKDGVGIIIDTYDAYYFIENLLIPLAQYAKDRNIFISAQIDSGDHLDQTIKMYNVMKNHQIDNVSILIGEGNSFEKVKLFDKLLEENQIPLNIVFYGVGAGFYKKIERDTLGFAVKTAYSNNQPRMKIVKTSPFKQSIPNMVHLVYNNGDMVVEDGDGSNNPNSLYEVIYEHDGSFDYPKVKSLDNHYYEDVRACALKQNTSQKRILLSKNTKKLINSIISKIDLQRDNLGDI